MQRLIRQLVAVSPLVVLAVTACLPYTVGSTARTVSTTEVTSNTSWYVIPNAIRARGDTAAAPMPGADLEFRHGLSPRSDLGLRILPGGIAIDVKHRMDHELSDTATAVSLMGGAGIVNGGEHFMVQGTVIASAREDQSVVPYGGLRAIQVIPISLGAVSDRPTIGAFGGVQLGDRSFTIRPELGVFYDHSALGIRRGDLVIVPAVTMLRSRRRDVEYVRPIRIPVAAPTVIPGPMSPAGCPMGLCAPPVAPPSGRGAPSGPPGWRPILRNEAATGLSVDDHRGLGG